MDATTKLKLARYANPPRYAVTNESDRGPDDEYDVFEDPTEYVAARAVSCWNAMLGIDDPAAFAEEHDWYKSLSQKQTDALAQLRASHERVVDVLKQLLNDTAFSGLVDAARETLNCVPT